MVKTFLFTQTLLRHNIEFRLLSRSKFPHPTSIFKIFKGRIISNVVKFNNEDEEVFIDGVSFGTDIYNEDILIKCGILEKPEPVSTPSNSKPEVYKGKRKAYR